MPIKRNIGWLLTRKFLRMDVNEPCIWYFQSKYNFRGNSLRMFQTFSSFLIPTWDNSWLWHASSHSTLKNDMHQCDRGKFRIWAKESLTLFHMKFSFYSHLVFVVHDLHCFMAFIWGNDLSGISIERDRIKVAYDSERNRHERTMSKISRHFFSSFAPEYWEVSRIMKLSNQFINLPDRLQILLPNVAIKKPYIT